ncbi:transcription repressor OFP8-like [Salvia splendens]|nr:transcription repressor OFP8-like [Salvia splendens]
MAENSLKIRIRRMLRSCKSKDQISDVVAPPHFSPRFSYALLSPDVVNGRKCPPASPIINNFYDFPRGKKGKRKGRYKKRGFEKRFPDCKYVTGVFSSDGEYEDDTWPMASSVEDSLAVVKRSSDPYTDFRNSMVEMIVEKHIFAATDLENLLRCFLSLNSYHHHNLIVQVFAEIWEAFFSSNHQ